MSVSIFSTPCPEPIPMSKDSYLVHQLPGAAAQRLRFDGEMSMHIIDVLRSLISRGATSIAISPRLKQDYLKFLREQTAFTSSPPHGPVEMPGDLGRFMDVPIYSADEQSHNRALEKRPQLSNNEFIVAFSVELSEYFSMRVEQVQALYEDAIRAHGLTQSRLRRG